jgi:hypothetical protein
MWKKEKEKEKNTQIKVWFIKELYVQVLEAMDMLMLMPNN